MSQRSKHTLDISDGSFLDTKTATGYRDTRRSYSRSLVRHSIHSISWKWPLIALVASAIALCVVHEIDYIMPTVVTESEALINPSLFSGERSRNTLVKLTEMGPRVVGSYENRVLAPGVITDEIKEAQKNAHSSQFLQYEVQRGSGAYNLEYKPRFTNVYHGIQNVIAVLEGSNKKHGILLNCHYDSVPTSDGASDDALICAIMIELIRVLSQSNVRLKHSLIFLFNGAEESGLHASHLFLKHRWFTPARIVLNMEAAGVGGRPIIFQSGPQNSWLIYYYATHAPHPHGHVMGEELFQSGALPSDTDFRIFRDFGKLPGLDIAFIRNGYLYHTKYDKETYIVPGCHQNLGENILSYLRVIGHAPEIENMKENKEGQAVYFDFLGWFMIRYSLEQGTIINFGVFLLSMFSIAVFIARINQGFALKELAIALGGLLVGMLAGLFATVTVGVFIGMVAPLAMPWYSNVWLLFPLFWCPCLLECGIVLIWVDSWREKKRGLSVSMATQLNLVAAQIPWAVMLLLLTIGGFRSTAVPMVSVLFAALANLAIHLTPLYRTVHKWVWVYLAVHIPCMVYQLYVMKMCYMLFIPSMGRSGTINGDVVIAVITWMLTLYCTSFAVPLFSLVRRPGIVLGVLLGFCLLMIPVSMYTSVGQPYKAGPDSPAPQRYWIMHTERSFYNESNMLRRHETGYFVLNLDRNSPRTIPQAEGRTISPLADDCKEELYCGLPLYLSRMIPLSRTSSWIPAPAPNFPTPTAFTTKERTCTSNPPKCTVKLLVKGPDRVTLTFAPREGVTLAGWDLPTVPLNSGEWRGRPSYFINVASEGITEDYPLTLQFNVTSNLTAPILDIGLAGNFVHHEKERTQEFRSFLNEFPEWTQITGWISSYSAYVI